MKLRSLSAVLAHAAVAGSEWAGLSDRDLLQSFRRDRDEAAFAEVVRRHGRLVWSACRHLLRNEADAEDAFQATFLALARSPGSVRYGNRFGPWLHGVAVRVCANARRSANHRRQREQIAGRIHPGPTVPDSAWDTAAAAVHAEVARLPASLRVPFVLCCLEGKGVTEAADLLGWKLGTLSGRLTRAKQLLLARLEVRGLSAGAIVAATAASGATAGVPIALTARVIELVRPGVVVAESVRQLSQGVIGMNAYRLKLIAAGMLLAGGLATSVGSGWLATVNAQTPAAGEKAKTTEHLRDPKPSQPQPPSNSNFTVHDFVGYQPASKWEYRYDTFTQAGGNARPLHGEFEKLLEKAEADGWQFVGQLDLRVGTEGNWYGGPALVFRRPKGEAMTPQIGLGDSRAEETASAQDKDKSEWLRRQKQAIREQNLLKDIAALQWELARLRRATVTDVKEVQFSTNDMPLDANSMARFLTPIIAKRFGDIPGRWSVDVQNDRLVYRGDAVIINWLTDMVKKMNEK